MIVERILITVLVSDMIIDEFAGAIEEEDVRNILNAQSTSKVGIHVEEHFIFETLGIDERLHLVDVLSLVDADSN